MITKSLKYFFLVLILYSIVLNSSESEYEKAKPELGIKYIFIHPIERAPSHGGAISIEYAFAKYFSLASELGIKWITPVKALDLSVALLPKFIFPISLENTVLVPYIGPFFSISPLNLVNNKHSLAFGLGGIVGLKFYFTKNWGSNLDFGGQADFRNSGPAYITGGLRASMGVIYSF